MKNLKIITIVGVVAVLAVALLTTSVFAMGDDGRRTIRWLWRNDGGRLWEPATG